MSIRRNRLSDEVALAVLELIRERRLSVGDRLPSQAELAAELGISVPSLREGLQTLAALGFIRVFHGVGTEVGAPSLSAMFDRVDPSLFAGLFTTTEKRDALEVLLREAVHRIAERDDGGLDAASPAFDRDGAALADPLDPETPAGVALAAAGRVVERAGNRLLSDFYRLTSAIVEATPSAVAVSESGLSDLRAATGELLRTVGLDGDHGAGGDRAPTDPADAERAVRRFCGSLVAEAVHPGHSPLLGTGSIGGSFYSLGVEIARIVGTECGIDLAAIPTEGGPANALALREGRIMLGMIQEDLAAESANADLAALCGLHTLDLWVVCRADSSVHYVSDLEGRRVSLGTEHGQSRQIARRVLEACGVAEDHVDAVHLPIARGTEALKEGSIDAIFYLTSGVSTAIERLTDSVRVRLLSLRPQTIERVTEGQAHWRPTTFVTGAGPQIRTVGTRTLLASRPDVPFEIARQIVLSLYKRGDRIPLGDQTLRGHVRAAMSEISLPLHPGAASAFDELGLLA